MQTTIISSTKEAQQRALA